MIRVHATLHKCLTMYYLRVMRGALNRPWRRPQFDHVESIQGLFYNRLHDLRVISCSGFAVDTTRLGEDFRIVRFVRDPRDLIVSGYFYHRRGAEPWFRFRGPTDAYWSAINGRVPAAMPDDLTYAEYLESLSVEDGLLAEIEFRAAHLESLRDWPRDDRIRLYRYESILGNERETFEDIADFYELSRGEKARMSRLAHRFRSARRTDDPHIRDPRPGQWQAHFTPRVTQHFDREYGDLIPLLGY
ncbi:MAG: sulfotransferase domain-containing protein [Pseudomonadota bacterium]